LRRNRLTKAYLEVNDDDDDDTWKERAEALSESTKVRTVHCMCERNFK
jgi:hypothetical protein